MRRRKVSEKGEEALGKLAQEYEKYPVAGRFPPVRPQRCAGQIDQSLNALSKHKPVLIYENGRPVGGAKVAKKLKKAGIPEVYILKSGLNSWNGKTKSGI